MKMTKMKTGSAIFVTALLLLCSNESLSAAQQAAYGFWKSFLPAMLPFFLLSPYLTSPDAQAAFSRVFGRALQALLRIPGGGAGALLCALAAGTPAGAVACAEAGRDMEADAYARLCCLCSGLSPAFLITAVGSGQMGDAKSGWILYFSHVGALFLTGILLRRAKFGWGRPDEEDGRAGNNGIFANALAAMGKVLCWMTVFAVLSRILANRLDSIVPGWLIAALCEISGGAGQIASAPLPYEARMLLLSGLTGFGGLCVIAQCAGATGAKLKYFVPVKALHGLLSAALTFLFLHAGELPELPAPQDVFGIGVIIAVGCTAAVFALTKCAKRAAEEGA